MERVKADFNGRDRSDGPDRGQGQKAAGANARCDAGKATQHFERTFIYVLDINKVLGSLHRLVRRLR